MIIGTQKAGTTSLYHYIKQHPDIYFSEIKEITYFVDQDFYKKGVKYLHSFFSGVKNEKVIASSFVHMLPDIHAPQRVADYNPDMKIVVCLRDPVTRANSAFHYAVKNGWETECRSLLEAKDRILDLDSMDTLRYHDLNYFENGLYAKHLDRWSKHFAKENIFIIKDDDLRNKSSEVLKDMYEFLRIDSSFEVDTSVEYNKASVVKSQSLQNFLKSKNSLVKKAFAILFSSRVKIWLRGRLVAKVEELNKVNVVNPEIENQNIISEHFKSDLAQLEAVYKVKL
jgi:hypothetical protein